MANRILRWVVYTLIFALLPTIISVSLGYLFKVKVADYTNELLFFIIMICATSLNDIQETKKKIDKDFVFNLFFSVCIILIVIVSVLYGSTLLVKMMELTENSIFDNIRSLSISLSILSGVIGLIIQIILHRTEVSLW